MGTKAARVETHFVATIKIERVDKTIVEDTYDNTADVTKRDVKEIAQISVHKETFTSLLTHLHKHLDVVEEA